MMCERIKTAIDVIKAQRRKTLTKEESLMLFEKVIEDNEKMGERMTNLEKRMESLESKMDAGFADIKRLIEANKPLTVFEKIIALKDAKMFWITIIVLLLILAGLFGVPVTGFNGILNIGG